MGKKNDGSTSDLSFNWIESSLGQDWLVWKELVTTWLNLKMRDSTSSPSPILWSIKKFFEGYLAVCAPYASDIKLFFEGKNGHICSSEEFLEQIQKTISYAEAYRANLIIKGFLDFVVENYLSYEDDDGVKIASVVNPFIKTKYPTQANETVRNPLPIKYIQELLQIISPSPSRKEIDEHSPKRMDGVYYGDFKHWKWAIQKFSADWFDVEPDMVDKSDPDCVWRDKLRGNSILCQIWSPVSAAALLLKLHLPLRTYQVRMLDSGEADTWRYEEGQWKLNDKHDFSLGNEKRPFSKGVFRRIHDSMVNKYSTALYINSNKTADQNKVELESGYVIPWEHKKVLYWLEKLRNWQEKYNPIESPLDCCSLKSKHTGGFKSQAQLEIMGEVSFLFRDASAKEKDRDKPMTSTLLSRKWYLLLEELEKKLAEEGHALENGETLKLVMPNPTVKPSNQTATHFPLHSLRVSLITAYTMDTTLPLPVISKLLVGHTRLLMTIYYNKITPSVMAERMKEAEKQLCDKSDQSVRNFLKDASIEQIKHKMVCNNEESVEAALDNRNPIGWEERATGICLVGGNTYRNEESSTLAGCWNGGPVIRDGKTARVRVYSSVPHGLQNCIRCRWHITEASYLPALNAKFNQLSYKAHQAANLSVEIEGELETLKDEKFFCEGQDKTFTKHEEVRVLQRRYEKQQVEADEYVKDWIACFEIIQKIIRIEEARSDDDKKDKFIAVGDEKDVSYALRFVETASELLHLSLLCDDAEFYPDLYDELCKTPAIQKRSIQLSSVMMKKGFKPIFMEMDDKQQLVAANAMLRQMAKIADPDDNLEGYRKVSNYIEAGEYLSDNKLFNAGIGALVDKPLHLENLVQPELLEGECI